MNNLNISVYTNLHKTDFCIRGNGKLKAFKSAVIYIIILFCCLLLIACTNKPPANRSGRIMVLSVSSDGNYVISSSVSQDIVLWNIPQKTYKVIANHANVYSAYFIKNSDDFIYQNDRSNKVYVMNVNGKTLKILNPGFPTYGEILTSDLSNYFAVNVHNEVFNLRNGILKKILYHYCGSNYQDEGPVPPKDMPYTCFDFEGIGKLFNFTLSNNEKFYVTSGDDEYYLWDASNASLIKDMVQNNGQTYATISPDNQTIISGDLLNRGYLYNTQTGKGENFYYNFPAYSVMKAYENDVWQDSVTGITAVKYIDNDHIVVFVDGEPSPFNYATLYKVQLTIWPNPHDGLQYFKYQMNPIKYLPLVPTSQSLIPITNSYLRAQAIDTSPRAHILVIAEAHNNGILVYQYDPKTQTLKQIWDPVIH